MTRRTNGSAGRGAAAGGPRGLRWRVAVLAALIATAAQLAPVLRRVQGHVDGYLADTDEMLYAAVLRSAARDPVTASNPFDAEWRGAVNPYGRILPLASTIPIRLGVPPGLWLDAARWLASAGTAALLIQLGTAAAAPAVGAAAAVLVLLDPSAFYGKPLGWIMGVGSARPGDPHQLFFSRLYTPGFSLPLFVAALMALSSLAAARRGRRRRLGAALAFASAGATGHFFYWTSALGAAGLTVLLHRRRRVMLPWAAVAGFFLLVLVALNYTGARGTDFVSQGLRMGFIRTRTPQFLGHVGYWAGALAAGWLAVGPWRVRSPARVIGAATVGVWLLAMLHTPLGGWDAQSFHFSYALGVLVPVVWTTLAWYAWRRWGRGRWVARAGALAVAVSALAGPQWARRGLEASLAAGTTPIAEAARWLRRGRIPDGAIVLVPRDLRSQLGVTLPGVAYAHPHLMQWALPDAALWQRSVCAAALTGEDSVDVSRPGTEERRAGWIALWPHGRPADVSTTGVRSYAELFGPLRERLKGALAEARRSPGRLRGACAAAPEYSLATGRHRVRLALGAAAVLSGEVVWQAADSSAVWVAYRERAASSTAR
ncbi:MAG: hypothetical protein HY705_07050 [Gemmatimonadetes bacterium]|nr:hypothetical protein [Gemmatimonadota bacterium]